MKNKILQYKRGEGFTKYDTKPGKWAQAKQVLHWKKEIKIINKPVRGGNILNLTNNQRMYSVSSTK